MNESPDTFLVQWKRPSEIKYPNIWHRFETKLRCGQLFKIRIEDLPEDRFEEAIDFMTKYYFSEEPMCKAAKLIDDGPALKIYQQWLRYVMAQRISIIAVIDNDMEKPPIVAMQCLFVETKGDRLFYQYTENTTLRCMWDLFDITEKKSGNLFEALDSNTHFQDWGLCTSPEFRGIGISSAILRTLTSMGQTFKLKGIFIFFTRTSSQKMAEKAGFKVFGEIAYNDFKNEKGQMIIPVTCTEKLKFMVKIF